MKIEYSGFGIVIREWKRLGLKLVYRLNITFELKVYLIGFWDAGLVGKYSQINIKLFLDYSNLD